jgi:hypothetical protein
MSNKNILKLSAALLLATSSLVSYTARAESELVRESVGVTVGARIGTLGVGAEAAFPINDYTTVRANIAYLPLVNKNLAYNNEVVSTGNISVSNLNGMALVDWHPFANAFRFSFGAAYNNFKVDIKDAKVDFSKLALPDTTKLVDAAAEIVKQSTTNGQQVVDAASKVITVLKNNIQPTLGPINYSATLENSFSPVAAFGADNSTDPDASFVYGFDVAFMLVNPKLNAATTNNSTLITLAAGGKDNIEAGVKEVVTALEAGVSKDLAEKTKTLVDTISTAASIGSLGLKTFGTDGFLSSVFGGKTIVPVLMGHVAFPIQ